MNFIAPSFLSEVFQNFYEEVLRQKERALRESDNQEVIVINRSSLFQKRDGEDGGLVDLSLENVEDQLQGEDEEEGNEENSSAFETTVSDKNRTNIELAQNIQRRLRIFLEEQTLRVNYQLGQYAQSNFKEAMYLMTALGDEVFLNLSWPGRVHWKKHLLETQLFHTQVAGELFFDRLDALLSTSDPVKHDLAVLYLLALSLGFRGKFKDEDDSGKIDWYKSQLFHSINHKKSDLFQPGRTQIMSAVYEHNVSLPPSKGLPDVQRWIYTMLSVVGVYIFVTYILWYRVVKDIDEALQFIFEQARMLPL